MTMAHDHDEGPRILAQAFLSAAEVAHVRETFARVGRDADAVASRFYERLFEYDPTLRRYFPDDMAAQREKLMLTLEHVVASLDAMPTLLDEVSALGVRHRAYGARDLDYATVGDALLFALEQSTGEAWTPDAERAWEKTYTVLSQTMLRAAHESER